MTLADDMLNLTAAGYVLVALTHGLFALRLMHSGLRSRPTGAAPLSFTLAVVTTAVWGALGLTAMATGAAAWLAAQNLADIARYGFWFLFLLSVLRPAATAPTPGREFSALTPLALLLVLGMIAGTLYAAVAAGSGPPVLTRALLFGSLGLPVLGLILVEQLFRNVSDDSRWNAKPVCLGLGCVLVFDIYHQSQAVLFGTLDVDAASIRGAVHALAVPLLYVASRRHTDWIGKLQISRAAVFQSATLLLAGVYLIFISAIGYYVRYFGGEWGRALQIGLLVLGLTLLLTLLLSGTLRSRMRVMMGKHLFRYRYDYRDEWLRFTTMLSAQRSPQETGVSIVQGLAHLVESPAGCLWTRRPGEAAFSQTARWNLPRVTDKESADSALAAYLRETGWIVDVNEYRAYPGRYRHLPLPPWWATLPHAWLLVPLLVGDELIGFVVLADARAPVEVNWEVTDLLKTASRQAASYLGQMHATEALLEARKFEAFNRMSAFVVHDLKNIMAQLSLMLSNAKRLRDNPEFQQDMLSTVESSLEKMRQLMVQLRGGEAPPAGSHGVDLAAIAGRIAAQASTRGRQLELDVAESVLTRGHEERIERVLGHMVQNAFDATPAEGRVWLKLERASGQARLEIGDTGHGMTQEFIESRLFKPFQTTKAQGMGIGSYESFQYVQELGGKIQVRSAPDEGTVLSITLPLLESRREADLYALSAK